MKLLLSLFVMLSSICISYNSSVLAASIEDGEKIFNANCAACHAGGKNVIMPNKTLEYDTLHNYEMDSIDAITTQVTYGKNAMPSFRGRLTDNDIENVANYVLSQSQAGWPEDD